MDIVELPRSKSSLRVSGARLELVKKYFFTLPKYRKFVIANRDNLKMAIQGRVNQHFKVSDEQQDVATVMRDCLVLRQIAIDV